MVKTLKTQFSSLCLTNIRIIGWNKCFIFTSWDLDVINFYSSEWHEYFFFKMKLKLLPLYPFSFCRLVSTFFLLLNLPFHTVRIWSAPYKNLWLDLVFPTHPPLRREQSTWCIVGVRREYIGRSSAAATRGPSGHYAHESSAPSQVPSPSVEAARRHGMAEICSSPFAVGGRLDGDGVFIDGFLQAWVI